jgi:hypothetical protein
LENSKKIKDKKEWYKERMEILNMYREQEKIGKIMNKKSLYKIKVGKF